MTKHERDLTAATPFKTRYGNFIGGDWVEPVNGRYMDNISPVNGQKLCEVPRSDAQDIERAHGAAPEWVVTEARPVGRTIVSYEEARAHLALPGRPALVLFGTAHGLHASVIDRAELVIEPIRGVEAYNHLSVRAAAAITFDRLFSVRS